MTFYFAVRNERLRRSSAPEHFGLAQANKWAGFIYSAGSYTVVYTITTNTSIVIAVSSNSNAVSARNCLHVDKFSLLKNFVGRSTHENILTRKFCYTKISQFTVKQHV